MPHRDADDLDWLLFRQAQVISRRQALGYLSADRIRRQLRNERWQFGHRAIYVAHNGAITDEQREWIGVLIGGVGRPSVALAGLSALRADGFRGYPPDAVHVYIPDKRTIKKPPYYLRVHHTPGISRDDLRMTGTPPRTRQARSVIDAARWAPSDDRARALITAAFQQRMVSGDDLLAAAARMRRLRRHDLIYATIHDAAGGSESISEHDFLRLCRRGRLPLPTRQSIIKDVDGRNRYRDAYFEEWNLHVEIDGSQHMNVESWWADMQRQNKTWTAGARVLRFPGWAIRNQPDTVIEMVRAALIEAGWRP